MEKVQSFKIDENLIKTILKNKQEFYVHVSGWKKCKPTSRSYTNLSQVSRVSSFKSNSSSSSKSSWTRWREVYANYELAKLKRRQADERALEAAERMKADSKRARAGAERQLEVQKAFTFNREL